MKRVRVIVGIALMAFAASAAAPAYEQWEDAIAAFEAADRAAPPPTNAVLFIGSSNIRMWNTLAEDFSEYPVIQRGFGGCRLSDVAHFADRIAIPYRPRLIVVSAGGNDLHAGLPPEAVLASFTQFVGTVRAALPQTRIAYLSISPCRSRWSETAAMRDVNARIKAFVEAGTNLDFISTYEAMLGPDGMMAQPVNTISGNTARRHAGLFICVLLNITAARVAAAAPSSKPGCSSARTGSSRPAGCSSTSSRCPAQRLPARH